MSTPNPVEWIELDEREVDTERWLDCPFYDQCLDYTSIRSWSGFTCTECPLFLTQDFM